MRGWRSSNLRLMLVYELKRTWRSFLPFSLIAAAVGLYLAAPAINNSGQGLGFQLPVLVRHAELVGVLPLLGVLVSAYAAWETQRDRRTRTEAIILAWPVPAWQWSLARSLAMGSVAAALFFTLGLLSTLQALLTSAATAGSQGAWLQPALTNAGLIAVDLLASLLGSQAIGQLAGSLLPGFGAMAAVILYRMAAFVGPGMIMTTIQWPYPLLASPDLILWNLVDRWLPYSAAFGLAPHEGLFFTHRLFWISGSLCAITALSLLSCRWREDQTRLLRPAFGAMVVLAAATAVPFLAHQHSMVAAQQQALQLFGQPVKPELVVQADSHVDTSRTTNTGEEVELLVPQSYRITADFASPPLASVTAAVTVQAGADLSQLEFTLRRTFSVEKVELNNQPVPAGSLRREGDTLIIIPARPVAKGEVITVGFTYSGPVDDWRLDPYENPVAIARRGMLVVPATWGWYPVPGRHILTWEIPMTSLVYRHLEDRVRPFTTAEPLFTVTLRLPQGITAVAGFVPQNKSEALVSPAGTPAEGETIWTLSGRRQQVSLLGGDFVQYERDGLEYLVPFANRATLENHTAPLQQLLRAAVAWIGLDAAVVVPYNLPDPQFIDAELFGPASNAGLDKAALLQPLGQWLRTMHRFGWARSPEVGSAAADYQNLFSSHVIDYVLGRIAEDSGVGMGSLSSDAHGDAPTGNELERHFHAWTQKTSREEQKQALRKLFAAARQRALRPEDFQFLAGGGK